MNFLNSFSNIGRTFAAKFVSVLKWTQMGSDIDGEAAGDQSGYSVSMNTAGDRMAIGAIYNDGVSGIDSGHVRIYQWSGTAWTQMGSDIDGETSTDQSGYSVSMNAVGDRVAIGAVNATWDGDYQGHVRVFSWNGSAWTQLGLDIDGEVDTDKFGTSVSINAAGNRVAIGAPFNNGVSGIDSGHVRIYQWSGTAWTQMGSDIDGEASGDRSGGSVSINAAGDRVAIGAAFNRSERGHVRIYQWSGTAWTQMGSDIDTGFERSGWSVSINAAGNRVAIGSIWADSFRGITRVYEWNGTVWSQLGGDIFGKYPFDQGGYSVSINSAGDKVAIGSIYHDGETGNNSDHRGQVRIFTYFQSGNSWLQLGLDINGEATGDESGFSASINAAGNRVAIGAPFNDGTSGTDRGHVRVYELK